ncbi:MAG: dephospho-CoA kinase [Betaproteobacteria bacterium]|nr:dephospho-CoA kinase [Betaproteobacteria bacterium]
MSAPDRLPGFIVGLTGGIGSGKSAAAAIFAELGAAVVDSDAIAHALTAPGGAAMPALRKAFSAGVFAADGTLDRAAMRRLVFADAAAKSRLEAILHPLIGAESQRRCEAELARGAPYAVLVVPLLIESGDYRERVTRVLVVDCTEATQVARVMARNGLPQEEVLRIMAAQATRAERLKAADDSIDNNGEPGRLRPQIEALNRQYLGLAAKKPLAG